MLVAHEVARQSIGVVHEREDDALEVANRCRCSGHGTFIRKEATSTFDARPWEMAVYSRVPAIRGAGI
jgi:hypothetical protein